MLEAKSGHLSARQWALYAVLAALLLLMALALRWPTFYEPRWYADEGIFAAIAQNIREGRTLYAEAWDNKPPLIFLTYAGIQTLFGTGVMPLHAVTAGVVLATLAAVVAIAFRLYGPWRSLVAGAVFTVFMCTPVIEGNLALTETYMILPATLSVLVFVLAEQGAERRRDVLYAASGVLMSIAISYKQVAVFDAAAVGAMIWLMRDQPVRAVAPFAAGVIVPQALLVVAFAAAGALGDYWYAVVGAQGVYSTLPSEKGPLVRLAGYLPALIVLAYLVRRRRLGGDVEIRHFPMLWLGFALAGATSSPFEFPHYLQQIVAPGALLLVSSPLPSERDDLGRIGLVVSGLLVIAILVGQYNAELRDRRQLNPQRYYETFADYRQGDIDELEYMYEFDGSAVAVKDIAAFVEEDGAGETLFAWSELAWVYAATETTNPTQFYASFFGDVIPGAKADILRDLAEAPPTYVVISDSAFAPFEELDAWVEERYELLRAQGDWRLYRLASAMGQLTPLAGEARS